MDRDLGIRLTELRTTLGLTQDEFARKIRVSAGYITSLEQSKRRLNPRIIKLVADTDNQLPAITYWLLGSLSSIKGKDALFLSISVTAGLLPLILLRWRINLLTVSEDEAKSLGINTGRLRLVVIICATLITAAAVSVSGIVHWVGLVIPHFCRLIFGYDYRLLIPSSILLGATFTMIVDNLARTMTTAEVPLGILTSFVGAPVFIWLILKGGAAREN